MKNTFENEYINEINSAAPDMGSLWEKISSSESDDEDISAFVKASEQCSRSLASSKHIRMIKGFAAAAAVFTAIIGISAIANDGSILSETSTAENIAVRDEVQFMDDAVLNESSNSIEAVSEWDFSSEIGDIYEYDSLSLADSPSGIYTALSANTEENEYFVESEVLGRTDFFVDGIILSSQQVNDSTIEYEVEIIRLISDEPVTVSESLKISSCSGYSLRINREYLIPVCDENDGLHIVFDNAPQIEFTQNRELVFHNGWRSLSGESHPISYPKVYADDYFYDRMNLAAEASLTNLFDAWLELKQTT